MPRRDGHETRVIEDKIAQNAQSRIPHNSNE